MAATAAATLESLEPRIKRLEHYLNTSLEDDRVDKRQSLTVETPDTAVETRLRRLETQLTSMVHNNRPLLELASIHAAHPGISGTQSSDRQSSDALAVQLPIVLASSAAYTDTVSKLTTLQQYPISESKELVPIFDHESRLASFEAIQNEQLRQVQELRQRSATLLAQWYQRHVLASSEAWANLESSMMYAEQAVRRKEKARVRDEEEY